MRRRFLLAIATGRQFDRILLKAGHVGGRKRRAYRYAINAQMKRVAMIRERGGVPAQMVTWYRRLRQIGCRVLTPHSRGFCAARRGKSHNEVGLSLYACRRDTRFLERVWEGK
jgi:hypothetical protein